MDTTIFVDLKKHGDNERGYLTPIEYDASSLPFEPKRTYWIYDVPAAVTRGGHAHKKTHQVFVCLKGSVAFNLEYRSGQAITVHLSTPDIGIYIPPRVWHTMKFKSKSTVLLALASAYHNEEDYIRDYDTWKASVSE